MKTIFANPVVNVMHTYMHIVMIYIAMFDSVYRLAIPHAAYWNDNLREHVRPFIVYIPYSTNNT